jgi:hypothetical protein
VYTDFWRIVQPPSSRSEVSQARITREAGGKQDEPRAENRDLIYVRRELRTNMSDPLSVKDSDRTNRRHEKNNSDALGRGVLLRIEMGTTGMEIACLLRLFLFL